MTTIGIVGVGYFGPNYARILSSHPKVKFAWCCDLNEEALRKMKRLYPDVQTTTKISDLVADETLDAVIIVTPAQTHSQMIEVFLNAGKDVLVEKPLTTASKDAVRLCKLAKKNKRILMVDHTFVFNAAIARLQSMVAKGELGDIRYLHGQYNALGPIRRDVSAMWDLPHFFYTFDFILGKTPKAVTAIGRSYLQKDMEDIVFVTLEYPGNIIANISCSWIDPVKIRKFVVVGSKKMASFNDMQPEGKLSIFDKGVDVVGDPNFANLQLVVRHGDVLIPNIQLNEPLGKCVDEFVVSIQKRSQPSIKAEDGLQLVRTLEAAQKSITQNGKRIEIV